MLWLYNSDLHLNSFQCLKIVPKQPFQGESWERQTAQDLTSFTVTGRITTWRRCLEVSIKSSLVKWKLRSMNWVTSKIKSKEKRRTERKRVWQYWLSDGLKQQREGSGAGKGFRGGKENTIVLYRGQKVHSLTAAHISVL